VELHVLAIELQVLNMQSTGKTSKVVPYTFQMDAAEFCAEPSFTNQYKCLLSCMVSYELIMSLPSPINGAKDLHTVLEVQHSKQAIKSSELN